MNKILLLFLPLLLLSTNLLLLVVGTVPPQNTQSSKSSEPGDSPHPSIFSSLSSYLNVCSTSSSRSVSAPGYIMNVAVSGVQMKDGENTSMWFRRKTKGGREVCGGVGGFDSNGDVIKVS